MNSGPQIDIKVGGLFDKFCVAGSIVASHVSLYPVVHHKGHLPPVTFLNHFLHQKNEGVEGDDRHLGVVGVVGVVGVGGVTRCCCCCC